MEIEPISLKERVSDYKKILASSSIIGGIDVASNIVNQEVQLPVAIASIILIALSGIKLNSYRISSNKNKG